MRPHHFLLALVLGALALQGAGCRARRSVRGDVGSGSGGEGGVAVGGGATVAHGTPREMLDQYDVALRAAGYEPVGPVTRNVLPPNGITPIELDVRRGYCYALAAFGAAGTNVDLVILDPRGAQIGHDVHTDAHPWVTFCAARGGRFVARIQQVSGEGEFFFAPYHARGRTRADLSTFFGGAAATDTAVAASLDAETQARIAALDASLGTESYRRVGEASGITLTERAERLFALTLEPGACYAFASFGGPGAADTDVYLVDGEGHWLAQDARGERDAVVRFCSPSHASYNLQVRLLRGSGPVFTAAYVQATATSPTVSADALPVISDTSTAGAAVDENFALLDADMRARGYEAFGGSSRGELSEAGTTAYDIDLQAGNCYAVLAVGDSGVRNLDLTLLDANAREVDRDDGPDARPIVRVCPSANGHFRMQVRMSSGTGAYFYAAYRWPRGIRGPFGLEGLIYVRLAELNQLLSVEGYTPDPGYDLEQSRLRAEGASATHTLRLNGGQCYSIAVVGGDGAHDIDVSLARGGNVVASDAGVRSAFSSVRRCVETTGDFTLNVTAASGSGPYLYQVFSRADAPAM